MNRENHTQSSLNPHQLLDNQTTVQCSQFTGENVIQSSETIKLEIQIQQKEHPKSTHPPIALTQTPQPYSSPILTNVYPNPASSQVQVCMSASHLGSHKPKSKLSYVNPKHLMFEGNIRRIVYLIKVEEDYALSYL
jgi:hypothetical protein